MSIVTDLVIDNETVMYTFCTKHEIKLIVINIAIAKNVIRIPFEKKPQLLAIKTLE